MDNNKSLKPRYAESSLILSIIAFVASFFSAISFILVIVLAALSIFLGALSTDERGQKLGAIAIILSSLGVIISISVFVGAFR